MALASPLWRFSQLFGDQSSVEVSDADIISTIEFDETGDLMAVGDHGGRVVVFEQGRQSKSDVSEFKLFIEFQSHEPEFDYLKSLEIEERINKIKWCRRISESHNLLTTNDKTIKLWKIYDKKINHFAKNNANRLHFPNVSASEVVKTAVPSRTFANAHAFHINSISTSSDCENYISADDLQINLWNLEISDRSFNIVDIKPENMEELVEVITAAEFHPVQCNLFMYSSSKGVIKLCDLRQNALCDNHSKTFYQPDDPSNKSFFSEIIASISDCRFSGDGRYILARDYMTLKVWDINKDSEPLKVIKIHDHIRTKLCDLYENDYIFDKFECGISSDGSKLVAGSYHNMCYIYDWQNDIVTSIEANKKNLKGGINTNHISQQRQNSSKMDFSKKCLHLAIHPKEDLVAVGATNNLFVFEGTKVDDTEH